MIRLALVAVRIVRKRLFLGVRLRLLSFVLHDVIIIDFVLLHVFECLQSD